jgi:hypothetical protein
MLPPGLLPAVAGCRVFVGGDEGSFVSDETVRMAVSLLSQPSGGVGGEEQAAICKC